MSWGVHSTQNSLADVTQSVRFQECQECAGITIQLSPWIYCSPTLGLSPVQWFPAEHAVLFNV